MSKYFTYFPNVAVDITQNGQTTEIVNILRRFKFRSSVENNLNVFYDYDVQNGDRPDTIAEKYYGSPNYAWIILHFNNIKDPIFDWPLFGFSFDDYIRGKYGSIPAAQAEVHEYRWVLNNGYVKYDGTKIEKRYIVVDQTTYNSLSATSRELISKYDYETEENERKRLIKILNERYLSQVRTEIEDILRNGI